MWLLLASALGPGLEIGVGALVPRNPLFVQKEVLAVLEFFGVQRGTEGRRMQRPQHPAALL